MHTVMAQIMDFLAGMLVRSSGLIWKWLTSSPANQVMPQGSTKKAEAKVNLS